MELGVRPLLYRYIYIYILYLFSIVKVSTKLQIRFRLLVVGALFNPTIIIIISVLLLSYNQREIQGPYAIFAKLNLENIERIWLLELVETKNKIVSCN